MDKKTIPVIVLLFAFMLLWPKIDRKFIKPLFPAKEPIVTEQIVTEENEVIHSDVVANEATLSEQSETTPTATDPIPKASTADKTKKQIEEVTPEQPEELWVLKNSNITITVSSYGACVTRAVLNDYPELNESNSPPVQLDFAMQPALQYQDVPDFGKSSVFKLKEATDNSLSLQRISDTGITLTRSLNLINAYEVEIQDEFQNNATSTVSYAESTISVGPMHKLPGRVAKGLIPLGIDILSPGGIRPVSYGKNLTKKYFKEISEVDGFYPLVAEKEVYDPIEWFAAKNKYFVQILLPENGGNSAVVCGERTLSDAEKMNSSARSTSMTELDAVYGFVTLPELSIEPGTQQIRNMKYYVGPKKYELLSTLGFNQEGVMEFATSMPVFNTFNVVMVPLKVGLLWLLNFFHDYIWPHSYGLAIILITILMRVVFWPITHKSTESMKRMSALQPLVKELRAKYKDEPQKMQQAQMALYKEHKVNPVSGCLPMVIQIPVFFALFAVLRAAIELRFAPFLWISDLSQPENLFADVLPIPLNILPLVMVASQFFYQKLTPTAGDPQQAKMMQFMPLMFLFIFYSMPSGLVLYWTTSNVLMIFQQLSARKKQDKPATA